METNTQPSPVSKGVRIIGHIVSALAVLALAFSGVIKLIQPASMAEGMADGLKMIGWRVDQMTWLGIVELACVVVYLIPQTSVLGAILISAYMGGAIATHTRVDDFNIITQVLISVLAWLGLFLRDPRLRALIPFRT